jgi:small-conductance mechanosensitive channel
MRTRLLGFPIVLGLGVLAALLWLSYEFASTYRVFGVTAIANALHLAASITAAVFLVAAAGHVFMYYLFGKFLAGPPTDLQRTFVVAIVSLVAAVAVLGHFNFGFGSVVAFSALLAVVLGLALQPLLVGLMSGLTVDRRLSIGDGFMLDDEAVEVISLTPLAVIGRRIDGTTIFLPNARFAGDPMEILPSGRSVRAEVRFDAPVALAPHRLQRIVSDLIADLPEADLFQPIVVAPLEPARALHAAVEPLHARYGVTYAVRSFIERTASQARVRRRLWYALRRESAEPVPADLPQATAKALRARGNDTAGAEALVAAGEALLYDDGERIALPARLAGFVCLLLDGALAETHANPAAGSIGHDLTWEASLGRIKDLLSRRIGPIADYAVDQAAADATSLTAVCTTVAAEIDEPEERTRFLDAAIRPDERIRTHEAGFAFETRLSQARRLLSKPPLEAAGHALILAIPKQLLEIDQPA